MQFRRVKRNVNGVLLLDKPQGISSNAALQHAKRLYQAAKAGHTGNLDPVATGLLPVCFGEATKFSQFLFDADKVYQAVFKLGETTTTGDSEGEVLSRQPVAVTRLQVEQVLASFVGGISQVPPMYSALKYQGKALYTYARAGVEIERKPRQITIYSLKLDAFEGDEIHATVACSKGTYIRVLGEDIGKALGCGAHMTALRRTASGGFDLSETVTLAHLEEMNEAQRDAVLLPVDSLLTQLPKVMLDADSAYYLRQGQSVWQARLQARGVVSIYDEHQSLMGVGEITDEGKIAPKRLIVQDRT